MWNGILDHMLRGFVTKGSLAVTYPDGTERMYGGGAEEPLRMVLHDPELPRKLVLSTDLALGEAYMDGRLTIGQDDLDGFLSFLTDNADRSEHLWWRKLAAGLRRARRVADQWNPAQRARANVAHHYDLSSELYDLFLDDDRQYSCAYFTSPDLSLEEAQAAKKRHIAGKLLLEPDMEVFEIGCGWGGLALSLARDHGVRVLGVTLSEEQHRIANERAAQMGLADRVRFELRDYRSVTGRFDRIVSVGMFEHVGVGHYGAYFAKIADLLDPDGVALVHTIGSARPPRAPDPWISKYIFPGGYVPSLSEIVPEIERASLVIADVEVLRLHYADTLKAWRDRFMARRDEAVALYDERFCRMWEFYLASCEAGFRHNHLVVFQIQLAHRLDAVPVTRDYIEASKQYLPDLSGEEDADIVKRDARRTRKVAAE